MAIPHGDPEKVTTITCAYFSHKRCFSLATTRCQTCLFLAIRIKTKLLQNEIDAINC